MRRVWLAVGAVLMVAGGAAGQEVKPSKSQPISTTTISASALKAKETNDEKVFCRTYEDTGTRLSTNRRCMTLSQWRIRDGEFAAELVRKLNGMISYGSQP